MGNPVSVAEEKQKKKNRTTALHHISSMFNGPEKPSKQKGIVKSILDFYFTSSPHCRTRNGFNAHDTTAAFSPDAVHQESAKAKQYLQKFL